MTAEGKYLEPGPEYRPERHDHHPPDAPEAGERWECGCGAVFVAVRVYDALGDRSWKYQIPWHLAIWRRETRRERRWLEGTPTFRDRLVAWFRP